MCICSSCCNLFIVFSHLFSVLTFISPSVDVFTHVSSISIVFTSVSQHILYLEATGYMSLSWFFFFQFFFSKQLTSNLHLLSMFFLCQSDPPLFMFLSSELSDVKEHDKIITREAQKTQEDVSVCGIWWLVENGWWQLQAQGGVNVLMMFVGL